jgi:hypothetical protein
MRKFLRDNPKKIKRFTFPKTPNCLILRPLRQNAIEFAKKSLKILHLKHQHFPLAGVSHCEKTEIGLLILIGNQDVEKVWQ